MSNDEKMRAFTFEGKRRGVSLDSATWRALDWIAGQRDTKWTQLAHDWATKAMQDNGGKIEGLNLTGIVRGGAMQALLDETILQERVELHASMGPIWESMGACSDDDFERIRNEAQNVEGKVDCTSFAVEPGVNEFGYVTFYIRNSMKDASNLVISTPFLFAEWAKAQQEQMQ